MIVIYKKHSFEKILEKISEFHWKLQNKDFNILIRMFSYTWKNRNNSKTNGCKKRILCCNLIASLFTANDLDAEFSKKGPRHNWPEQRALCRTGHAASPWEENSQEIVGSQNDRIGSDRYAGWSEEYLGLACEVQVYCPTLAACLRNAGQILPLSHRKCICVSIGTFCWEAMIML